MGGEAALISGKQLMLRKLMIDAQLENEVERSRSKMQMANAKL